MRLSVHLVTWNGSKYIPHLFDSLKKQTFKDFKLVILDNASTDNTVEKIEQKIRNWKLETGNLDVEFIKNKENKGFAGGHNQLITNYQLLITNYILLLNQDMYLLPDCLEKLVKFMDEHPDAAAVSPRLMRWRFDKFQVSSFKFQDSFTNQIDTLGLKILRNRRVVELNTGENWDTCKLANLHTCDLEVFGVSGALPMYRKSATEEVGLFDESFGSYKEDVDLAFRLRSAGHKAYVLLDAVAYHDRSAYGLSDLSDKTALENKKKQSELIKYNSYKNHLMTLIKNEYWQNYLLDLPWIKWYELKKFAYFLLFDRKVLKGLGEIWRLRKELGTKRCEIKNKRKISWREMREWWS